MFRFFRKIRSKLLDEGHLSKYTYYAIGEILLVVAGILIALQINNWNEQRKVQDTVDNILRAVQDDLINDLREFTLSASWSRNTKSLIDAVLSSQLTANDYSVTGENFRHLFWLGTTDYMLKLSNASFQRLSEYRERIPDDMQHIVDKLNSIYIEDASFLSQAQMDMRRVSNNYRDFQYENLTWLTDSDMSFEREVVIPQQAIEYFLHDGRHKRYIKNYERSFIIYKMYVDRILQKALLNYLVIDNQLGSTNHYPAIVNQYWQQKKSSLSYNVVLQRETSRGQQVIELREQYGLILVRPLSSSSANFYFQDVLMVEVAPDELRYAVPLGTAPYRMKIQRDTNNKIIAAESYSEGKLINRFSAQ